MDERTNFERHEDNLDFETEKPSPAAEAKAVFGLTVEVEKPPVKANTNLEAPLPAVGTGVHGENVSTPQPQPQSHPEPASKAVLNKRPDNLPGRIGIDRGESPMEKLPGKVSQAVLDALSAGSGATHRS